MKNFIIKLKAFIKMITPFVKYGIQEYKQVKEELKALKEKK